MKTVGRIILTRCVGEEILSAKRQRGRMRFLAWDAFHSALRYLFGRRRMADSGGGGASGFSSGSSTIGAIASKKAAATKLAGEVWDRATAVAAAAKAGADE